MAEQMSMQNASAKPRESLTIVLWNILDVKNSIKHGLEGETKLTPRFKGKRSGLPHNSAWKICADLIVREGVEEDSLGVYLVLRKPIINTVVKARYEISLLNRNGEEVFNSEVQCNDFGTIERKHGLVVVTHRELFDGDRNFLDDDTLRVKVKLWNQQDFGISVSTRQDFSYMWDNPQFADVSLKTRNGTLEAKKSVLAAQSGYFSIKFSTNMGTEPNEIINEDFDFQTVKRMVHFMYFGIITEEIIEDCVALLKIADFYQIESLKTACIDAAIRKMSEENVLEFLILGNVHNAPELKSKSIQFMNSKNSLSMFSGANGGDSGTEFRTFAEEHPMLLLEIYENLRKNTELGQYSVDDEEIITFTTN